MRRKTRRALVVLVLATTIVLAAEAGAPAAIFVVTSQGDVGDGLCDVSHCSLRDAIQAANATAGTDEIVFNVFESIVPVGPLPVITERTHISWSATTGRCRFESLLQLDGEGADFPGLVFAPGSDGSRICRVNVRGFTNGIEFRSGGNAIERSILGTTPAGTAADPNSAGILVSGDNNLIGGRRGIEQNLISGNTLSGVRVDGAVGTRIAGNLIGTDSGGRAAIGNAIGVEVTGEASETTVGGTDAGAGNVISGNSVGVVADEGRVVGNLIGLDATGVAALPNFGSGVLALGPIQIGGRSAPERNVIGGHEIADVVLQAAARVEGNWIGLAADGTGMAGDSASGIRLLAGAEGARIGGSESGAGNVVAGHRVGVESVETANGFSVQGNLIGLAPDGTKSIPTDTGIRIGAGTTGAQVGGVEDGAGNTVAGGGATGIAVAGERSRIEGNTVGLNKNGDDDVSPQESGIAVEATAEGTTIGGDERGAGNTISGNLIGVELQNGSAGTVIEGNFIGTDRDGMDARPNDIGVAIGDEELGGARVEARIGGTGSAQRNVISGNFDVGVSAICAKAHVAIEGNYIGVAEDGSTALGNGTGLLLGCDTFVAPAPAPDDGFVVGGTAAGAGNRIAHNNGDDFDFGDGVQVDHTSGGVMILGNEIFANDDTRAPGIDLFDNGVNANGSQDPAVLPPFPVLTNVDAVTAGTLVAGTIDYPIGRDVRVEFFSNPGCDESGHGEGQNPLGALTLTGSGEPAAFSARVAAAPAGHVITATATDLDLHRTSEFSRCALQTTGPPPADPPPDDPPPASGSSAPPATGPVVNGPAPPIGIELIDPPPRPRCEVPNVIGLNLSRARQRLRAAGCGVGKVTKPKRRPGKRYRLVVKRTSLRQGTTRPPGAAIGITLRWKRVKTRVR